MRLPTLCGALIVALLLPLLCAHANPGGISLNQSRIIFSAEDTVQNLTVKNSDPRAWLIQAQITGENVEAERSTPPFVITPPLSRVKGESQQLLRIFAQPNTLPADRESLFYVSVSALPSQDQPVAAKERLSVGLRFVLKLFYRPKGLGPMPADTACRLVISRHGQGIQVSNPTPYYQTLGALTLDKKTVDLDKQPSMVAPHSSLDLKTPHKANQASWQTVNDFGGLSSSCQQTL